MVKINFETSRIAIIGSTILTKSLISYLQNVNNPKILMALPKEEIKIKANGVSLERLCNNLKIKYIENNSWDYFGKECIAKKINLIIEFGDSRIIPSKIIKNFFTIGNHGASLPTVKGGASLVWGRLANLNEWGVSLMNISNGIDNGDIIAKKKFIYSDNTTMSEFVQIADRTTLECLEELVIAGTYNPIKNSYDSEIRIEKHYDSFLAVKKMKDCINQGKTIYMPPRTIKDSKINYDWPGEFIEIFKIANNDPYPKFY